MQLEFMHGCLHVIPAATQTGCTEHSIVPGARPGLQRTSQKIHTEPHQELHSTLTQDFTASAVTSLQLAWSPLTPMLLTASLKLP